VLLLTKEHSLAGAALVQIGKVESPKKVKHKGNFEKHKCRDKKVAHRQTYELNYKTNIWLVEMD
jgi:hypothetical protein